MIGICAGVRSSLVTAGAVIKLLCNAASICTRTHFRTCAKHRLCQFWLVSLMEARRSQPPSGRSSSYLSGTAASPSALGVNVQTHWNPNPLIPALELTRFRGLPNSGMSREDY